MAKRKKNIDKQKDNADKAKPESKRNWKLDVWTNATLELIDSMPYSNLKKGVTYMARMANRRIRNIQKKYGTSPAVAYIMEHGGMFSVKGLDNTYKQDPKKARALLAAEYFRARSFLSDNVKTNTLRGTGQYYKKMAETIVQKMETERQLYNKEVDEWNKDHPNDKKRHRNKAYTVQDLSKEDLRSIGSIISWGESKGYFESGTARYSEALYVMVNSAVNHKGQSQNLSGMKRAIQRWYRGKKKEDAATKKEHNKEMSAMFPSQNGLDDFQL